MSRDYIFSFYFRECKLFETYLLHLLTGSSAVVSVLFHHALRSVQIIECSESCVANASLLVGNVCSSFTFRAAFVHICPMSNAHSSFVGIIANPSLLYCLCFCVVTYASLMHPSLLHCCTACVCLFSTCLLHTPPRWALYVHPPLLHLLFVNVVPYPCLMCTALSFIDGLSCATLAIASFHFSSCLKIHSPLLSELHFRSQAISAEHSIHIYAALL